MTVYENCKIFWENYSKRELDTFSLMNLEPDHKKAQAKFEFETAHVERVVKFDPKQIVVDLGSGPGIWSEFFAKRVKQVYAIEREIEFVRMCRERNREKGIRNVDVLHADLVNYEYNFDIPVDLVFLSGVTIYLEDSQFQTLLAHIHNFLRTYSAIYRTREEYDRLFARHGFKKTYDCDMYPIQSTLNKWKETRLRLALYENILKGG
jgi:SAM-dependent methyltransferase